MLRVNTRFRHRLPRQRCQAELCINISPVHNSFLFFLQPENKQYFGHDITVYVIR
jgi:hypothetical protein